MVHDKSMPAMTEMKRRDRRGSQASGYRRIRIRKEYSKQEGRGEIKKENSVAQKQRKKIRQSAERMKKEAKD